MALPIPVAKAADEVYFPDPVLREEIRSAIGGGDITQAKLDGLHNFTYGVWDQTKITDLTGLEYCTSLSSLNLNWNQISDISPIAGLTGLTELYLRGNYLISDVSPLSGHTSLTDLDLSGNQISNVSSLSGLTSLNTLILYETQISSNMSSLSGLTSLTDLDIRFNHITDISPLSSLTSLTSLILHANNITDISPLSGLTSLTWLDLRTNQISNVSPLSGLTNLTFLSLDGNQINDISPLSSLTSLTSLGLNENLKISDISPLSGLTSLAYLSLSLNQISDVSPLSGLTSLIDLTLSNNWIVNIEPLVDNIGIADGDTITLIYNPLSDISINDYIPQLEARGVVVWYLPTGYLPGSGGGCFIATAAFGTPMAEEIQVLRDFRDQYLLTNPVGKALVELYYNTSPPVADFIAEHPALKQVVRAGLEPVIAVSSVAVNTNLAQKIAIVSSMVLLSALLVIWLRKRVGRGSTGVG